MTATLARVFSRIGLAFCFISFGAWEVARPPYWVSYVPSFVASFANPLVLVRIHGVILAVLGLLVLFGLMRRIATLFSVLMMFEITISLLVGSGFTEIFVRDVTILFLAISLMVDAWRRR